MLSDLGEAHHSVVNYANGGDSRGATSEVKAGEIQFVGNGLRNNDFCVGSGTVPDTFRNQKMNGPTLRNDRIFSDISLFKWDFFISFFFLFTISLFFVHRRAFSA